MMKVSYLFFSRCSDNDTLVECRRPRKGDQGELKLDFAGEEEEGKSDGSITRKSVSEKQDTRPEHSRSIIDQLEEGELPSEELRVSAISTEQLFRNSCFSLFRYSSITFNQVETASNHYDIMELSQFEVMVRRLVAPNYPSVTGVVGGC